MEPYLSHIRDFHRQFDGAVFVANHLEKLRNVKPDGIIVIGMGGSGLAGDLLQHFERDYKLPVPVAVWKNYGLPETHLKRPLFAFVSFSGTTEETLSGLAELLKSRKRSAFRGEARQGRPAIGVVTTGGPLLRIAQDRELPCVSFPPEGLTPREAIGYTYTGLKKLLHASCTSIPLPGSSPVHFESSNESRGKAIARVLKGTIPVIYTTQRFRGVGYIWKINLNETAKQAAFTDYLSEMDHNEIAGFQNTPFKFTAIFLVDPEASQRIAKRITVTARVLRGEGVRTVMIPFMGRALEEQTWNSIALSHFVSFYLAKLNKANPSQTRLIDTLKLLMKR